MSLSFGLNLSLCIGTAFAQPKPGILSANQITIHLFSSTPLENIKAETTSAVSVLNIQSKEVAFQVKIRSFVFPNVLMQEHFNENYLESEKFPMATFKGIISDPVDFGKKGNYSVNVKGILTMHGIAKSRTIAGELRVLNDQVELTSTFDVPCADHHIKIPTLVSAKIAETITVTVNGKYSSLN